MFKNKILWKKLLKSYFRKQSQAKYLKNLTSEISFHMYFMKKINAFPSIFESTNTIP